MFTQKEIDKNKEGVIEEFEKLATENPKVFRFLLSKYGNIVFDSMPWAELWADEPYIESAWGKIMPILTPIIVVIMGIVVIIAK